MNNECPVTGYANSQSECQAYGEYCKFTGTEFHCMNPYTCVERTGRSDCSGGPYYWENASCHINETLCEVNIERDCWDKRFCSYQAKNGTCVESCSAVKTKTEWGTGCQWKESGTCAKKEKEVSEGSDTGSGTGTGAGADSDSDSSNYVKFLNYLSMLFLFIF